MKRLIVIALLLGASTVTAQTPKPELPKAATEQAKAPELTDKQRDVLTIKLQAKAIADQQVTIAQANAKAATDDAIAFLNSLQVDGYDFNYQTGAYTKKVVK